MIVDALIVGSGPVGATFARMLTERLPASSVLMVDLGPRLTSRPGHNIRNLSDAAARVAAQIRAQGPHDRPYRVPSLAERARSATFTGDGASSVARPGTHLVSPPDGSPISASMPAAALSSNVGGMAAHWTCACPRPAGDERIPFIPAREMDGALHAASVLLDVTTAAYPETPQGRWVRDRLAVTFDASIGRGVQAMPLACRRMPDGRLLWAGADTVLGPLADAVPVTDSVRAGGGFELRDETICRRLIVDGDRVTGAVLEHLPTRVTATVRTDVVIVAADALRTPQLLWASGIRPAALGRYLNDQPQVLSGVRLHERFAPRQRRVRHRATAQEPVIGVIWVPYSEPDHPFHGQVMHLDQSPLRVRVRASEPAGGDLLVDADPVGDANPLLMLSWYCTKEIRSVDRVRFSDDAVDAYGMPRMTIEYGLTDRDFAMVRAAIAAQARAAGALGRFAEGDEPRLMLAGSSLHYQGSVRMGTVDDGTSVCDSHGRVWGVGNLFVGGNGVIPTATACNPTLTSVALAVRASHRVVAQLSAS